MLKSTRLILIFDITPPLINQLGKLIIHSGIESCVARPSKTLHLTSSHEQRAKVWEWNKIWQQSHSCSMVLAWERKKCYHMNVTWSRPHSTAAELEINGAHGESHTCTGGDDKLKDYFVFILRLDHFYAHLWFISAPNFMNSFKYILHKNRWTSAHSSVNILACLRTSSRPDVPNNVYV